MPVKFHSHRGVALCVAAALTASTVAAPSASARSSQSSLFTGQPADANSSVIDASSTAAAFSSLRSDIHPVALPALLISALMGGLVGYLSFERFAFENSSKLGSSGVDLADTFPDPDAPPAEFVSLEHVRDNLWELTVYSPSMQRNITNDLVLPEGGTDNTAPRPTFYPVSYTHLTLPTKRIV